MILIVAAVSAVTATALGVGAWGIRLARTTSDLFVASRAISPAWNAAAISGEYLSAASFLGIAGLEMKLGAEALWLPIGFTAGYLLLLLFVAAPLRRFGSYTISDFAEARLGSPGLRSLAAIIVLAIAAFYLVPQLKGAGLALRELTGAPYWLGVLVVGVIVTVNVAAGGMRGITYMQAFQYWVKLFAILVPACVLLVHLGGLPNRAALFGSGVPRAPSSGLVIRLDRPTRATFPADAHYRLNGHPASAARGQTVVLPVGRFYLPPRAAVPAAHGATAATGRQWSRPVTSARPTATPLYVYSLLLATFLGTMGLPHILVRFYTSPDGSAARRTTVRVLGLLGLFYLFPLVYGALGRVLAPTLYVTGGTDTVVLAVPGAAWPGLGGEILTAIVAAGAFAAFISTSSGLLVSIAGTVSYDVLGRRSPGLRAAHYRWFRIGAVVGVLGPAALALAAQGLDISLLVGWAFALAASTFCPMFVLGIWWPHLTARGAAVGMIVGAVAASGAIFVGLALGEPSGVIGTLLAQPAVVTVPLAFLVMVIVSLADGVAARRADSSMLALHAPEGLGFEDSVQLPR